MKDYNNINQRIRAQNVRLIDENGQNLGILNIREALDRAREKNLDLVEMSRSQGIPICKILDYNKYLYDQKSRFKKVKSKKSEVKELIIGPNIGEGDLDNKIKRAKEFLADGDVVRFTVKLERRAKMFPEFGIKKLKIVEAELADMAKVEKFSESPNSMFMIFVSKG